MRTKLIFFGNLIFGFLLLSIILWLYGGPALLVLARDPSLALILAFAVALVASITSLSWRWGYLLAGLNESLSLHKLVAYRSGAHTLAILIPSGKLGGDPLRAWLAIRAGVSPPTSIASVAVDRTQEIGSTAPFSLIFAALLIQADVPHVERALITVGVGVLGLAAGVTLSLRRLRRGAGLISALIRSTRLNRINFIRSHSDIIETSETSLLRLSQQSQRMIIAFVMGLFANLVVILEFAFLLSAFDLPANTTAIAAALFATGAAHLLPIPASVGVLEGAQIWIFGMLGYPADIGLAVGLAARLRELLWMLPGVIYLIASPLTDGSLGNGKASSL
ncbi:MAG: hypothetical protein CL917_15800 [Deltaproteobacteria bacterium]|nr:hypothetical protein [Deltaproteobacteria bacterium]